MLHVVWILYYLYYHINIRACEGYNGWDCSYFRSQQLEHDIGCIIQLAPASNGAGTFPMPTPLLQYNSTAVRKKDPQTMTNSYITGQESVHAICSSPAIRKTTTPSKSWSSTELLERAWNSSSPTDEGKGEYSHSQELENECIYCIYLYEEDTFVFSWQPYQRALLWVSTDCMDYTDPAATLCSSGPGCERVVGRCCLQPEQRDLLTQQQAARRSKVTGYMGQGPRWHPGDGAHGGRR